MLRSKILLGRQSEQEFCRRGRMEIVRFKILFLDGAVLWKCCDPRSFFLDGAVLWKCWDPMLFLDGAVFVEMLRSKILLERLSAQE